MRGIHACIYIYIHTHIYRYSIHIHIHIHTPLHTYMHPCMYACIRTNMTDMTCMHAYSSACSHSAVPKEQLRKQQQHDTPFCCNGQQSFSPKVVRSIKSNRTIGTVRPFGHWKASAADPKPEGPGWVGGSNLYTEPKDLETNHSTHSLAELYVITNEQVLHAHTLLYQKRNCESNNSTTHHFAATGNKAVRRRLFVL